MFILQMLKTISVVVLDLIPLVVAVTFSAAGSMLGNVFSVIGEGTSVEIGVFAGGVVMLVSISWVLSGRIQRMLSRMEEICREMDRLNKRQRFLEEKIERRLPYEPGSPGCD